MTSLTRSKTDDAAPSFTLSGPRGDLTFESETGSLSADGDLPPWSVAQDYANICAGIYAREGEAEMWAWLEVHYGDMLAYPSAPTVERRPS
jgi:hypothetical protein